MSAEPLPAFSDNWAYLRTELNWLDRVLMLAVARYRQDKRGIDHLAQNSGDRVSSHWWKGVVSLDSNIAYDEHRKIAKPANTQSKSYNQQLETRIKASQSQGIVLALPALRDRLRLTAFEKNVILLGLAPEVNRRYARIYRYLQGQDDDVDTDLPTVELVLRLFCRNDNEWRTARYQIAYQSSLRQRGLLTLLQQPYDTLLTTSLKLAEPLIRYLLAETPSFDELDALLEQSPPMLWHDPFRYLDKGMLLGVEADLPEADEVWLDEPRPTPEWTPSLPSLPLAMLSLQCVDTPTTDWAELVLPEPILAELHHLVHRVQWHAHVDEALGVNQYGACHPGTLALFIGASGTGKSLAMRAIATELQTPLHWVDLSTVLPEHYGHLIQTLASVPLLLLKASHLWLASPTCAQLDSQVLRYFLAQRRRQGMLTVFTVQSSVRVAPECYQEMDQVLTFPFPHEVHRLALWKKVLNSSLEWDQTVDLSTLSKLSLSGGEIIRVARDGAIAAAARQSAVTLDDLKCALQRQGKTRVLHQLEHHLAKQLAQQKPTPKRSRRRSPPKNSTDGITHVD